MQNRTLERSKTVWKQIIVKQWSRLCAREEMSRRRRKAVMQTYQQGELALVECVFHKLKTYWLRAMQAERMEELFCPRVNTVPAGTAPGKKTPPPKLIVRGAGGRGEVCNGTYNIVQMWQEKNPDDGSMSRSFIPRLLNDRPAYVNENGAVVYWKKHWKMKGNRASADQRYFFSMPGSVGLCPPAGQWTTAGHKGESGEEDTEKLPTPAPTCMAVGEDGVAWVDEDEVAQEDIINIPRMGLMQNRLGQVLFLRSAFVAWTIVKMVQELQSRDMGNLVSTSANYVSLRHQSIACWIRRARLYITREDYCNGIARIRNRAVVTRVFSGWKVLYMTTSLHQQHVMRTASSSTSLSFKSVCFQNWARSSWEYAIKRQVSTRIEQLEETMRKQKEIWNLRVHELKEALKQAKRAQEAPEDDQAKAQYALRKRQMQKNSWPAFFRSPKVSDPVAPAEKNAQPRFSLIGWAHFSDEHLEHASARLDAAIEAQQAVVGRSESVSPRLR